MSERAGYPSWSEIDELHETLRVVLETRGATYAAIASSLREIERRLLESATRPEPAVTASDVEHLREDRIHSLRNAVLRLRVEAVHIASAIASVAALVETPLTGLDGAR